MIDKIDESILDIPKKEYCPDVIGSDGHILDSVRYQILNALKTWKKGLDVDFRINQVEAKGSLLSKRYDDTTDIDVSIFTDLDEDQIDGLVETLPKDVKIEGTEHPIDFYVLGKNPEVNYDNLDDVYDIGKGKWIKRTPQYENPVSMDYVQKAADFFLSGSTLALDNYRNDRKVYDYYKSLDSRDSQITDSERNELLDQKKNDLKADLDALKTAVHALQTFRKEGYNGDPMEFSIEISNDNPHLTANEQIFKLMQKMGTMDELKQAIEDCQLIVDDSLDESPDENEGEKLQEEEGGCAGVSAGSIGGGAGVSAADFDGYVPENVKSTVILGKKEKNDLD